MVFHTAPPHPASKARMTCSPQLVGGPEASQKGLGQRMPAKLVVRAARCRLLGGDGAAQGREGERGALAIGNGVDDLSAAIDAIAAGVVFRIGGAAGGAIHEDR